MHNLLFCVQTLSMHELGRFREGVEGAVALPFFLVFSKCFMILL